MTERTLRSLLIFLGVAQLAAGAWVAFGTHSFGKAVASFDGFNEHDLRDFSTFFLAFGITLLVAAARRQWRFPILVLGALEYAFHAINHVFDINKSDPSWVGPAGLAAVAAGAALFAWLAWITAPRT